MCAEGGFRLAFVHVCCSLTVFSFLYSGEWATSCWTCNTLELGFKQHYEIPPEAKMVGPSSLFSKILLGCMFLLFLYFLYMDISLYFRIQNFPIRREGDNATLLESELFFSCDISPLCDVTVKSMMLDHANHYLLSPLATLADRLFGIRHIEYITPNMISAFHVLVAVASAKCIASDSLVTRRVGVGLFELRSMLDDLDGHVARARKHIRGETSEIGSVGYFVDGLCDALGTIALLVGCLVFLKNNPPRRGYMQLQTIIPQVLDVSKDSGAGVTYKGKITSKKVVHKLSCFGAQMLLSSTAWNRYIALYQDLLERHNVTEQQAQCQIKAFRSSLMWTVAWLWRLLNPHALIHALLIAIFCDKVWELLRALQYIGFFVLLGLICISEMHVLEVQAFIYKSLSNSTTV